MRLEGQIPIQSSTITQGTEVAAPSKPLASSVKNAEQEQSAKPLESLKAGTSLVDRLLSNLRFGSDSPMQSRVITAPLLLLGGGLGLNKMMEKAEILKGVNPGSLATFIIGMSLIQKKEELPKEKSVQEKPIDNKRDKKENSIDIDKLKSFSGLTLEQIEKLPAGEIKKFNNWRLNQLSENQIQSLDVTKLNAKELNVFLDGEGLPKLSKDQIGKLLDTQQGRVIDSKLVFHPLMDKIESNNLINLQEAHEASNKH